MLRRTVVSGIAALGAGMGLGCRGNAAAATGAFTPEAFGARGDGRTNDTAAFRRMAEAVNRAGGGIISLRRTTYLVGAQRVGVSGEAYAFAPEPILRLARCTRDLTIEGNGATLRCAPALRYGTFDRQTGRRINQPMPNTTPGALATPYDYMVLIEECRGAVRVANLELDGAVGQLQIGGQWGDTGWQIPCVGLFLRGNIGDETVSDLHLHHHAQDGLMITGGGPGTIGSRRLVTRVRSDANGRQGCSFIGGGGYVFTNCTFSRTGRGQVSSAPGAGFDIEAETGPIRRLSFVGCAFVDNAGCGMVADSGDSADVAFTRCRFVGTTNWSIWSNKPGIRYERCEIVGAAVRFFSSENPALATRFFDCVFTDSPARSVRGKVFMPGPMADLSDSQNVLFARCRFEALHGGRLPWSTRAIFQDCVMRQSSAAQSYPRGTFRGVNSIEGNVDLYNSRIGGKLTVNGRIIPPSVK